MSEHFNGLTPAEAERLAVLVEECGEVVQAACKVLRHGYESSSPDGDEDDNRALLEIEMGHVRAAMIMLCDAGDTHKDRIHDYAECKKQTIPRWLHHQGESQS